MDKQMKLIVILLCIITIFGVIFALKVTGVIKKKENLNIVQQEEYTNTTHIIEEKEDDEEKLDFKLIFIIFMIRIVVLAIVGVMAVGFYKAYLKLGIPEMWLKIAFIGVPILYYIGSLFIGAIAVVICCIIGAISLFIIHYNYFKCLDMNGSITFIAFVPAIISFLNIPFVIITIDLIVLVIMIIYGIIASIRFAKAFNKSSLFTLGMIFLPFIFVPILGYSKD